MAGKTTQLRAIGAALSARGLRVAQISYPTEAEHEPLTAPLIAAFRAGGLRLAEDPALNMLLIQELFCLNRREAAGRLGQLLADNDVVVSARYQLSGLAYGEAGGIDPAVGACLQNGLEADLRRPDLTVLVDIDPASLAARRAGTEQDVLDRDLDFQGRVRSAYLRLAAGRPDVVVIDGRGQPDEITARALATIDQRLPELAG